MSTTTMIRIKGTVGPIYQEIITFLDEYKWPSGIPDFVQIIVHHSDNEITFISSSRNLNTDLMEQLLIPGAAQGRVKAINGVPTLKWRVKKGGFIIVYPNDPNYKGVASYLKTDGFRIDGINGKDYKIDFGGPNESFDTRVNREKATIFPLRRIAAAALKAHKESGEGKLPGRITKA